MDPPPSEEEEQQREVARPEFYVPPGAVGSKVRRFGSDFEEQFTVPRRLSDKPNDLIEAVNDFHYAMMNDHPRNAFYRECLSRAIVPGESVVLEIGTGSGLLSMIAAKLGARRVVAVEASASLALLARRNLCVNGLSERVEIINKLSTDVTRQEVLNASGGRQPDVVVSELFGTLLLGESALEYLLDARNRLVSPNARIVPPRGVQYAVVVECEDVAAITSCKRWDGFSLAELDLLQDTASVVFTKQYGFRFSSVHSKRLTEPIPIFEVDFSVDSPGFAGIDRSFHVRAQDSGTAHCVLVYWEATIGVPSLNGDNPPPEWQKPDEPLVMSTDPETTRDNFARDMQWGQGIQLVEDVQAAEEAELRDPASASTRPPTLVEVRPRDPLQLQVVFSSDSVVLQFQLRRD